VDFSRWLGDQPYPGSLGQLGCNISPAFADLGLCQKPALDLLFRLTTVDHC
jgi:hypothetical protein